MKKFIVALLFLSTLTACEKVIDVDLNSKDPQLVIEGNITNTVGPYKVTISKTVNFSDANSFPEVTDAAVTISDDAGNSELLIQPSPGVYATQTLVGTPGRTYTLTAVVNGKTYTSVSTMPLAVAIDTVLLLTDPFNTAQTLATVSTPIFTDPVGTGNYYRFLEYKNNVRVKGFTLYDDLLSDGLTITVPLFISDNTRKVGDSLRVEMECIDQPTHLYFYTIPVDGAGVPANPESTFTGGCLGYFSAHTLSVKTIVIE